MSTRHQLVLAGVLVGGALAATLFLARAGGSGGADEATAGAGHDHGAAAAAEARPVRLDERSRSRIGVTYAEATLAPLSRTVRAVGTVTYDETRLVDVSPKISGWVETLYVDFTGDAVRRGQPLLTVYSPSLVSAQEELILARRLADRVAEDPGTRAATNAAELLAAARRRLDYWDIPADEIARIERSGVAEKALLLRAPASGIVVEKGVVEGGQIGPGTVAYRIADLSRVWVEAEVFEKDLSLLTLGREARLGFETFPGETFTGTVSYIYPTVSVESRTGRVRIELDNPALRLKPGMYAEIHLETPGAEALQVPRSAVIGTGERSVVFVRAADGTLVPREVTTGLASGDRVEVLAGLEPGEVVVSSAAFLIDAESNLGAAMEALGAPEAASDAEHEGHGAATPGGPRPGSE